MNKLLLSLALTFVMSACGGSKGAESVETSSENDKLESANTEEVLNTDVNDEPTSIINEVDAEVDSISNEIDNVLKDLN